MAQRQRQLRYKKSIGGSSPPGIIGNDGFQKWSVSVSEARVFGRNEDRVQFPNGPLDFNLEKLGRNVPRRRLNLASSVWWVRFPSGPLSLFVTKQAKQEIIQECASGKQVASKTAQQGSIPCTPAFFIWLLIEIKNLPSNRSIRQQPRVSAPGCSRRKL